MLREQFDSVARRRNHALALIDGGARISYAELASRAGRFALHLVEEAELRPGDRVAVCLPNRWEVVAGFLAVSGIGAVWVPFHPEWRGREIAWLAGTLPPRLLITSGSLLQPWRESGACPRRVVLVDDPAVQGMLCASPGTPAPALSTAHEPAVCFPTSGSTARPRIVPRTQANLDAAVRAACGALPVRAGMRVLSVIPFHHSGGFDNCLLVPLLCGGTAVLLPSFTPASVETVVADEQIQVMMGSPFLYRMLLESGARRESFASVETAASFGAPMPPDLARSCLDQLGLRVRQLYGASETGVIAIESPDAPIQPGVVGRAVGLMEIRILDEQGHSVAPGCVGDIAVRGPGVMTGYVDQPGSAAALFVDGFLKTGDLGALDASGRLTIRGRSSAVINLGGIKVAPAEIEEVLLEMPEVRDCVVRGIRDERQGEIITATLAVRPGRTLSRRAVVAHCRRRLAEFKIPRRINLVGSLPVETSGKRPRAWTDGPETPSRS
jgi:acyl-CoA synthetase (AMP-forming)/AMP-acid ligase II